MILLNTLEAYIIDVYESKESLNAATQYYLYYGVGFKQKLSHAFMLACAYQANKTHETSA